jgi:hypothetical protein
MKKSCNSGLDQRCRDQSGEIRHKNGSTHVATLRQSYGSNFAEGFRSDMKLDTLLNRTGARTLSDYLKHYR